MSLAARKSQPHNFGGRGNAFWKDAGKVDKIQAAFAIDAGIGEACEYAGISRAAYYRYKQKNRDMVESWERKSTTLHLKAKQNIADKIHSGDAGWSAWFLTRRNPNYTPKTKNELSGPEGKPLGGTMSPEHQKLFERAFGYATARQRSKSRASSKVR